MSRPSRPGFLQPARSAPAPASVTNTNVTAAMVSIPSDIDIDGPDYHHDTEHRPAGPNPGSVTAAPSTTGSTTTTATGRASSAFSLPFFAGSSSSKRSTAPTVSSVSTAPQPLIPVPNVHAQAYTGQTVLVPAAAASTSGASSRTATTGSSTSGASTTTTTTNVRRAAPGFPPASQSQSQSQTSRGVQQPPLPHTPHTPSTPHAPPPSHHHHPAAPPPQSPTTNTALPTAQARTAVLASISNLLDRELTGRASLLHQNHSAILKQEREMSKAVDSFKKDNDKLEKLAREGTKRLKEVGDVQNWAEVLERGFLRVEETIRRANNEWSGSDYSGSYSGSGGSYSGSWSGSERGDEIGDVGVDERGEGKGGDEVSKRNGGEQEGEGEGSGSKSVEGEGAAEAEDGKDDRRDEEIERDAEGDVVMTTEDDVQERHTKLDKGKGKAVNDTIPDPSMVPLPQSPELSTAGGTQFLSLTPAAV